MSLTRTASFRRRAERDGEPCGFFSASAALGEVIWQLRLLLRDDRGLAAIEFALVVPFLALVYLGSVQLLPEIIVNRQVTLTATTVANIVSQYTTISASTQLPDILNASTQIMAPYSAANATVVVTAIAIDNAGSATVLWSQALNGSARTTGVSVTVPPALDIPNATLILSEVTYAYAPVIDFLNVGTLSLYTPIYILPRASTTINLVP